MEIKTACSSSAVAIHQGTNEPLAYFHYLTYLYNQPALPYRTAIAKALLLSPLQPSSPLLLQSSACKRELDPHLEDVQRSLILQMVSYPARVLPQS